MANTNLIDKITEFIFGNYFLILFKVVVMNNRFISILKWIRRKLNKYWIACIIFIIVTFLIGDSTIFKRIAYVQQINHLKSEIKFYTKEKEKNLQKLKALYDDKKLEKLAREQYLMTKPNEELFVIVENK